MKIQKQLEHFLHLCLCMGLLSLVMVCVYCILGMILGFSLVLWIPSFLFMVLYLHCVTYHDTLESSELSDTSGALKTEKSEVPEVLKTTTNDEKDKNDE